MPCCTCYPGKQGSVLLPESCSASSGVPQHTPHEAWRIYTELGGTLQPHIQNLPDLDLLEAYWNHVNSILPHEKHDSDHLIRQLLELHEVHFPDLAAGSAAEAPSPAAARDAARGILHQVEAELLWHTSPLPATERCLPACMASALLECTANFPSRRPYGQSC